MLLDLKKCVLSCKAVAHRAVESMMPPPPAPAPVVAQPAPSVVAPPGGTVTRQSAMNPQGSVENFNIYRFPSHTLI